MLAIGCLWKVCCRVVVLKSGVVVVLIDEVGGGVVVVRSFEIFMMRFGFSWLAS